MEGGKEVGSLIPTLHRCPTCLLFVKMQMRCLLFMFQCLSNDAFWHLAVCRRKTREKLKNSSALIITPFLLLIFYSACISVIKQERENRSSLRLAKRKDSLSREHDKKWIVSLSDTKYVLCTEHWFLVFIGENTICRI